MKSYFYSNMCKILKLIKDGEINGINTIDFYQDSIKLSFKNNVITSEEYFKLITLVNEIKNTCIVTV